MKNTLLIADPDRELCQRYGRFFAHLDYQVETAHDGLECLNKLRQIKPDALIMEMDLPWGGGDGVLACMSEEQGLDSIPVVLVRHSTTAENQRKPDTRLIHQALAKPCSFRDLLATVTTAVANRPVVPPRECKGSP